MKAATVKGHSLALGVVTFLTISIGLSVAEITSTLSYSTAEEVAIGTLIGEVGTDAGLDVEYGVDVFPTLQLSIVDQGLGYTSLFRIASVGILETNSRIDRDSLCPSENSCVINLDIQVNPSQYFHIIKVTLTIRDQNDNAPFFRRNPATWPVNEGPLAVGEFTSLSTAIDNDSPKYGVQRYSLNDTSGNFELRVQNSSGAVDIYLYLQTQLDRETQDTYSLQVIAYDGGSPPKQGILYVNIQVQDINDNKPSFSEEAYSVSVSESLPTGSTILVVSATDKDIGPNGQIVYSLATKTFESFGRLFAINSTTGEISIVDLLDHEEEKSFALTIVAKNVDPTTNSMSSLAKVQVNVLDINDNAPSIKVHGTTTDIVQLSEGANIGDFVAHITVQDPDSGPNGKFSCLLNNNFFQLQQIFETDFKIVTTVKLDRESKSRYELSLECRDQGADSRAVLRKIYVDVMDENDNPPQFSQPSYGSSILENNNRGTLITRVQASDRDAGRNGEIRYKFLDNTVDGLLKLDSVSGNITARVSFDHETNRRLDFKVVATDLGEAPNTATVSVVLDIMDVDDEKAEFSKDAYEMFIYEGQPIKSEVGEVNAEDRDSAPFNKFKFSLNYDEADANSFTIEPDTGKIFTSEVLDREKKPLYEFIVSATSLGLHPVTSTAAVSVFVADKNDEDPVISFPTMYNNTVYMSNRAGMGEVVTRVRAHDPDSQGDNSRLSFAFLSGNEDYCFSIGEQSGAITVERDLSYISHQLFGLVVAVRDHGTPPRTSEAFLNIIVNKSIGHTDSSLLSSQNLTIVITIASVSGILMVILIVAIVVLLRWPWLASRKYNYVARLALRQNSSDKPSKSINASREHHQVKQTNLRPDLDYPEEDQKFPPAQGPFLIQMWTLMMKQMADANKSEQTETVSCGIPEVSSKSQLSQI